MRTILKSIKTVVIGLLLAVAVVPALAQENRDFCVDTLERENIPSFPPSQRSDCEIKLEDKIVKEPMPGSNNGEDEVLTVAAKMPEFPGGNKELMRYICSNLRYPPFAQDNKISGRVIVQFVVEKDGSIGDVKVVRAVHQILDQEAIRLCKSLPKFIPGHNANGYPVRVWYTLPITFKLVVLNPKK